MIRESFKKPLKIMEDVYRVNANNNNNKKENKKSCCLLSITLLFVSGEYSAQIDKKWRV